MLAAEKPGRLSNCRPLPAKDLPQPPTSTSSFEKHLDLQSGRYYHVHKETGAALWDVPVIVTNRDGSAKAPNHIQHIPLSPPSIELQHRASDSRRQYAQKRARERQERLAIVHQNHEAWRLDEAKAKAKAEEIERRRQDAIWKEACDRGVTSSTTSGNDSSTSHAAIRVAWQKFGYISPRIYSFEQDYGSHQLIKLCLEGNNLQSIGDIALHCTNLTHLSLASNSIRALEAGDISRLTKLEHLNLLRNQLRSLPDDIGKLSNLRELEIAGNCLTHLPDAICELQHLRRLSVECNNLVELPEGIGDMAACQEINANSNALVELPRSICRLATLRKLLVNDNKVHRLPSDMGNLANLHTLHASKNEISELPSSLCQLQSLQSLWLDHNPHIAALPADFHHLRALRDLKMGGNPNMVLPPIEKLAEGARAVLRWSECRYASNQNSLQLSIIMSVQDVLRQVSRNRAFFQGGDTSSQPLASVFEENVDCRGRLYYQFLPETLWEVFLPKLEEIWSNKGHHVVGIRSFPYSRDTVEKALMDFRDAGGKVAHHYTKAKFRQCSCRDHSVEKTTCGRSSQNGWMCQRPALLLRMNIIRERDMTEKKRKNIEEARIDAAVESARRSAKRYLLSDQGKRHVHQQAEERVVAEGLAAAREVDEGGECGEESDDMSLNASENTTLTMASTVRRELARKATTMKIKLHPSFSKKVQKMEALLREEYINTEIDKRRKAAEETNRKMKSILSSWLGMSTEEAFFGWKDAIQEAKRGRRRDVQAHMRAARLQYESDLALLEYANRQFVLWKEHWDEFNDAKCWINEKTGESTYQEPTVERFLPNGWSMSEPPPHIIDDETGKFLDRSAIEEIEIGSISDCCESECYSTSLDDQSTDSKATEVVSRQSHVTFAFLEKETNRCADKVGVDLEAANAAERILKRKREILLKKRKAQRSNTTQKEECGGI